MLKRRDVARSAAFFCEIWRSMNCARMNDRKAGGARMLRRRGAVRMGGWAGFLIRDAFSGASPARVGRYATKSQPRCGWRMLADLYRFGLPLRKAELGGAKRYTTAPRASVSFFRACSEAPSLSLCHKYLLDLHLCYTERIV
jgi:hypothetical protein